MPRYYLVLLAIATLPLPAAPADTLDLPDRLTAVAAVRPRLLLRDETLPVLRQQLDVEAALRVAWRELLEAADATLATAPVERVLVGRRLLGQSRTALARVLQLGLVGRLTGERAYVDRAAAELEAIAAFSDWNPGHFLDVAEMTTAAAFGYDWLHAALTEEARTRIRSSIIEKGLRPSLTFDDWTRVSNNWNPVCHAGMVLGALAVADYEPELAASLIQRAVATLPLALREYAPDGAYPEGASYWSYGTSFTVMLLSALESALGTDFGLSAAPGFLATADYYLHVTGPTGLSFNYGDAFDARGGRSPAMPWFALRRNERALLWHELAPVSSGGNLDRLSPLGLVWLAALAGLERVEPSTTWWSGGGATPVAMHRSSWDPTATFVALKGGSPFANHGHMDVGSFVLDADGVRWAHDLGADSYQALEAAGLQIWDNRQSSERWKVFRLAAESHNILQVDGHPQQVAGHAPLQRSAPDHSIVDLSSIYEGQLTRLRRGVRLLADRSVVVQDELVPPTAPTTLRWAMLTRAEVEITSAHEVTLREEGSLLRLRLIEPAEAQWQVLATDPRPSDFDSPNPGTRQIGFVIRTSAAQPRRMVVRMVPGSVEEQSFHPEPMDRW